MDYTYLDYFNYYLREFINKVIKPNDEEQMQDVIDLIENKYIYI